MEDANRGSEVCPVSGLSIFQRPEWIDMDFGRDYRDTLRVLEGSILHSRPSGRATRQDTEQVLEVTRRVSLEVFGRGRPYVQIEDYRDLRGATLDARKAYIREMKNRLQVAGLVFCNTSPLFKMSVQLAKGLNLPAPRVYVVPDYPAAVNLARDILQEYGIQFPPSPDHSAETSNAGLIERAEKDWLLRLDGFSIQYEKLGPDVVHTASRGELKHAHIPEFFEHMDRVFSSMHLRSRPFFLINDLRGVQAITRRARKVFVERIIAAHGTYPFRLYLFYGGNRSLRAGVMLSRHLVPYPVRMVSDLESARQVVNEARVERPVSLFWKPWNRKQRPVSVDQHTRQLIDEFIRFLGDIRWEASGPAVLPTEAEDPAHPLNPLFEAVSLIKGDIDQLLEDRAEALRALELERTYLVQLFETSQMAVMRGNTGGVIEQVNREFTNLFGYTADEIIGRRIYEFLIPDSEQEETISNTQRVDKGEQCSFETMHRHKDGTLIHVEVFAFPIFLGEEQVGAYCMYRDIRERNRAERALRESEERYRGILENMNEGYYEVDLRGNFTFVNPAMSEVAGIPTGEILGMNNRDYMDEETSRKVYDVFTRVLRTGRPEKGFILKITRKDGSVALLEISADLILSAEGEPTGFRGVVRDVTEREAARKEKERLEAQLQHAQRMEAVGTLAGGIAHNFNNILMGIQGNASLMALDLDPEDTRAGRLKTIEKLVRSGSDLTRQLLGYAREGRYEVRPVDLNDLVREMAETFGAARREIRVHTDLHGSLNAILADRGQVEQAIMNLLVNAADAMPQGGDLHLVTKNRSRLEMGEKPYIPKAGNYVLLEVRDTGTGMDEETRSKIFEPFFTTKGLSKGTGLGLASVYGIVKAHGGYIDVTSRVGEGTSFEALSSRHGRPCREPNREGLVHCPRQGDRPARG